MIELPLLYFPIHVFTRSFILSLLTMNRLREPSWRIMDASRSIPEIESDLLALATEVIKDCGQKPLGSLWTNIAISTPSNKVVDKENVDVSPIKKAKIDADE